MLDPIYLYLKDESKPRWKGIVFGTEAIFSWIVLIAFVRWGDNFFQTAPKVGDLTTGLIAYSAIALGFCVAGLTISLTIPDRNFALLMAKRATPGKKNAYSDLLFVFSWTAIVHWVALICMFGVVLFVEGNGALLPPNHSRIRLWCGAAITAICFYCLCQFLITLITLSQVGAAYIGFLIEDAERERR
jgi:hypothetical protein